MEKKTYADLKQQCLGLEKLLQKVLRKKDRQKGSIPISRLNKKINFLKKRISKIKKQIREIDRKFNKPAFVNKFNKNDVLNLESAGKKKCNPDGSLFISKENLSQKNSKELLNNDKLSPDGKLFISSSRINKLTSISGEFVTTDSGGF